jgi:hypothetical protein
MPKRVIDFDAMWASDKIASCADWAQAEYAWLYGLADASGCFELTNPRVIWGRVSAIRKNLTLERLAEIIDEFIARGLLFTWEENGKRYGHWTGSDVPGRLPAPSWRARLERLAPPVPRAELAAYSARFAARRSTPAVAAFTSLAMPQRPIEQAQDEREEPAATAADLQLNLGLELAQAQDRERDLNKNQKERNKQTLLCASLQANSSAKGDTGESPSSPAQLLEIYEAERGSLPRAERLTPERRRQCVLRLTAGLASAEFRLAVRRAAGTPFLVGSGDRGWRANFDWFVANDTNIRRVLEGCYDARARTCDFPGAGNHSPAALYAGAPPAAALCGVRVNPAALERIRARDAAARAARFPHKTREVAGGSGDADHVAPYVTTATSGVAVTHSVAGGIATHTGNLLDGHHDDPHEGRNEDQNEEVNRRPRADVQKHICEEKAS